MGHMPSLYQYLLLPFHRSNQNNFSKFSIHFYRTYERGVVDIDITMACDISRITKVILKNCQKIGKMTPLTVKNGIFKKIQKSSIFYGARFTQPKYHNPR